METTIGKAALSVDEAFRYIGIGRAHFYRLMDQGEIASFHIGRRRLVLREHLDQYIRSRLAAAGTGAGQAEGGSGNGG